MIAALQSFPGRIGRVAASRLVQNVGALALVQAMAYLVPLVTLPYLTRVLGPQEWGRVAWMQVIIGYFTIVTDWGFSWSGVRKIAALRNDRAALSESFFAGWTVQWMLCAGALGALCGLSLYAPFFAPFRAYALSGAGVIVAGVLFPVWLLTGLERLREVAVVQLAVRASAVPLILLLVKAPGDGPLVVAASALTGLLGGAAALIWMRGNLALDWRWPRRRAMRAEFLESGAIFLSRVWIVLYTSLTPTILGAVAGAAVVGQYVLADKVCGAAQSLVAPLAQALFPRMSYLFAHDQPAAQRLLWRSAKLIALVSGAMSVALFLLAEPLVLFAAGRAFLSSVPVLRWLAPLPLVVAMSNVLGVQIMLARGMFRSVNRILRSAGIISLVTVAPLSLWMGAAGAALNTCVITCLVTVGFAVTVFRTKAWC